MLFSTYKTERFYNGEQELNIMVRNNLSQDDFKLEHDITFYDASRGIVGCFNFDDFELRDMFHDTFRTPEQIGLYVLALYDRGEYALGNQGHIDQMRNFAPLYSFVG